MHSSGSCITYKFLNSLLALRDSRLKHLVLCVNNAYWTYSSVFSRNVTKYIYVIVYAKYISFMFQHCVILENIFTLPLVKMQRTNLFHLAFGVPSGNWCVFFRMHQDCEKNGFRYTTCHMLNWITYKTSGYLFLSFEVDRTRLLGIRRSSKWREKKKIEQSLSQELKCGSEKVSLVPLRVFSL